jgi:hypothetical protein
MISRVLASDHGIVGSAANAARKASSEVKS